MVRPPSSDARAAPTGSRGPLIHVSTRCASIDEFVAKFAGFASYGALVLPAAGELPAGTEGRFVIRLADRTVAMRGRCRVTDVKSVPVSPGATGPRRTLLRVALLEMEEGSRSVHARLLAHRRQAVPLPVTASESEPTLVSSQSPVPPPPLRTPPPPPVAALARTMTMIGVAPPTDAGKSVAAAPLAGSRVRGVAFTPPANPLGSMPADDLASFIDSTLFETDDEDATAERAPERPPEIDVPIEETAAEQAAPTAMVGPVERTSRVDARELSRARRLAVRVVPSAICLVVGLLAGRAWLSPARPAPPDTIAVVPAKPLPTPAAAAAPARPLPTAAAAAVPVKPVTPKAVDEPEQPVATPATESARPKTAASGDCTARIVTEPPDAKVVWGGKVLGQSPIASARVPCGPATVTIERERYQLVAREVTAEAGAPADISQRLRRPPATLIVNSSPPRAYVAVNDQMLGAAPRRLAASRFEQVSIRATFPGYQPWTKKIYLKEPTTTITVQLVPTGRSGDAGKHPPAR